TGTRVAQLPIVGPYAVAFNRTGTRAYITAQAPGALGTVEVYDANSYSKISSIPVSDHPRAIAVTRSGRSLFVVNGLTNGSILQISTATNAIIRTIPVGDFPAGLGFKR